MTRTRSAMTGIRISSANSKAMVIGFALVATGGLISMCGLGISGTALVSTIRRWAMAQPEPPSAIVKHKIAQAKAATTAGTAAWQKESASSAGTAEH